MLDVADDGHFESREAALVRANRQHVEQPLCGVRQVRLAGADDRHVRSHMIDQEFRHARFGIANHEYVGVHRLERVNRVQHALALGARAGMQVQVEYMRPQAPAGEVERGAGAGARFEEQICKRHAGQFAAFVGRLTGQAAVAFRAIEDGRQRVARQPLERDEVAQAPRAVLL